MKVWSEQVGKELGEMRISMPMAGRGSNQSAFSLMEVAISLAIVAVVFASYMTAVGWGMTTTRMQRDNLRATQILVNHMEGIRLFSWDQLTDTSLLPTNFTDYYFPAGTNSDLGTEYTGTVSIVNATLSPPVTYSSNMYLITVTLTWNSENHSFSRSMSTYQAMYGMQNYVY
jgi:prepilin-type N-terminal cleavage/methylation domain-containing protein